MSGEQKEKELRAAIAAAERLRVPNGFDGGYSFHMVRAALAALLERPVWVPDVNALVEVYESNPQLGLEAAVGVLAPLQVEPPPANIECRIGCTLDIGGHDVLTGRVGAAHFRIEALRGDALSTRVQAVLAAANAREIRSTGDADVKPVGILTLSFQRTPYEQVLAELDYCIQAVAGAVEFALRRGSMTILFGGIHPPGSCVSWGKAVSVTEPGSAVADRWCELSYPSVDGEARDHRSKPLSRQEHENIARVLGLLGTHDESDLSSRFERTCWQYQAAAEQPSIHMRLLHYWQVLEAVTLADRSGGKTQNVVKRVKAAVGHALGADLLPPILSDIADRRNSLVHKGRAAVSWDDVVILKLIVDFSMTFLSGFVSRRESEAELEWFFKLHGEPDASLAALERVSQRLRAMRAAR